MSRILVIDDDEANRDVLVRRLTRSGHHVKAAKDGETGVEEALQSRPDLVLVDIRLGDMDGWSVIEQIRKRNSVANPKFIAMTAFDGAEFFSRSIESGCSYALSVPYQFSRLLECVSECVAE